MRRLGVIGAGGWGTALAVLGARRGLEVRLWARSERFAAELASGRENARYLPGVALPASVEVVADLARASDADILLLAVPSVGLPEVARALDRDRLVVSCAKGLASGGLRLSEALGRDGFGRVAVLSGPNHAEEVGRGLPAAAVVASGEPGVAEVLQGALSDGAFRVYTSADVAGVEFGGALKNVVAIAAGLADGLGLGDNARAALLTRGLREIVRFAVARGAREETLYGLSGMGDLVVTCTSAHSRNRAAGERLSRGEPPESGGRVAEGILTAARATAWARDAGVDMPIARVVHDVAEGVVGPVAAVARLMARALRPEID